MSVTRLTLGHRTHVFLLAGILLGVATVGNAAVTLDSVQVVSNATGSWDKDTTPGAVAHNTTVKLRAVFKVTGAANTYYWYHTQGDVTGIGTVHEWTAAAPGCPGPTIQWQRIMPKLVPTAANDNDPWDLNYDKYTNVVANKVAGTANCPHAVAYACPDGGTKLWHAFGANAAHAGGTCAARRGLQVRTVANGGHRPEAGNGAIIEYTHTDVAGTELTVDTTAGVTHYTVAATYGGVTKHSKGREYATSVSNLVYEGAEDAYANGIRNS